MAGPGQPAAAATLLGRGAAGAGVRLGRAGAVPAATVSRARRGPDVGRLRLSGTGGGRCPAQPETVLWFTRGANPAGVVEPVASTDPHGWWSRLGSPDLLSETVFVRLADELIRADMVQLEVHAARSYCWISMTSATTQLTLSGPPESLAMAMSSWTACSGSLVWEITRWISSIGTTVDRPSEQSR